MNQYDTPAGHYDDRPRLNLKDVQRDNYFGNSSMPLGMSLVHRPTGIKVSGTGRPDNSRRDTGWRLFEELMTVLTTTYQQRMDDLADPEGVASRAARDEEIQRRETESRYTAIGKNPADMPGAQATASAASDAANARIAALEAQIALLIQLQTAK